MRRLTKRLPDLMITPTDDEKQLKKIEESGSMNFNDGVLMLSTSLQCFAFAKPLFFQHAEIDTGFGRQKINAIDLRKYLTRQKSFEGSLFEGVA